MVPQFIIDSTLDRINEVQKKLARETDSRSRAQLNAWLDDQRVFLDACLSDQE